MYTFVLVYIPLFYYRHYAEVHGMLGLACSHWTNVLIKFHPKLTSWPKYSSREKFLTLSYKSRSYWTQTNRENLEMRVLFEDA